MDGSAEKMTACGRDLFRLRTEQGLPLGEVARRAGCSTPYLSNVSYGRKHLTPRVAGLLDKVLGTAGTFAAYAAQSADGDDRRAGKTGAGELSRANIVPVIAALRCRGVRRRCHCRGGVPGGPRDAAPQRPGSRQAGHLPRGYWCRRGGRAVRRG
jgi:transcriptional regulator with XRE-family HTH domain